MSSCPNSTAEESDSPNVRCDDPITWRHKGEKIDLPRLLQLIEDNGGPDGLDLHGCDMSRIGAGSDSLRCHVDAYAEKHGVANRPPWLALGAKPGIDLHGAHLEGANLWFAYLQDADLRHLRLQDANLRHADLRNTNLRHARLDHANLQLAHLEEARLLGAHLAGVICYGAYLDGTRVARKQFQSAIGDELAAKGQLHRQSSFHAAREAYLVLKNNFDSIGRYDDASWSYVKEQQMEKAMHFPTSIGHEWIRERMGGAAPPPWWGPFRLPRWLWWKLRSAFHHSCLFLGLCPRDLKQEMVKRDPDDRERDEWFSRWRWARNWAYELLTGYGERPQLPFVWAVATAAMFTAIYAGAGNVASGEGGATHDFVTALTHSIAALATVGFNTLEPVGWGARLLTAIEAMFGIGLFALFVFTLGNRMRRS